MLEESRFLTTSLTYIILIAGTSMGAAKALLESRRAKRISAILRKGGGVLVILIGLYFLFVW